MTNDAGCVGNVHGNGPRNEEREKNIVIKNEFQETGMKRFIR